MATDLRFHRQLDLAPPDSLKIPITVIGTGGIGSFTVLSLAKMGCTDITVFDDDTVENHNLPNQFFREEDIGKPKVEALKEIVKSFTGTEITAMNEKFEKQPLKNIIIVAVDTMDVRIKIWDKVKYNSQISLYIDSRMGAEVMNIFTVIPTDPDDIKMYEHPDVLFPSTEAYSGRCTARAIMYNVLTIAAIIAGQVKKHCVREELYKKTIIMDTKNLILI